MQAHNDEGVEQIEIDRRNHEQIHRGDVRRVIAQKRPPSLTGRPTSFDHVLCYRRLCDLEPQLQ